MSYRSKMKYMLISAGLLLCSLNAFGKDAVVVYFIPFEIETYVPVTQETIVSSAWEKWTISSKDEISYLIELLNSGKKGDFDGKRVRGFVCINNQNYFIDSNGVVLKGKLSIQMDKAKFLKFRNSLRDDQKQSLRQPGQGHP